jgi:hypothetical protein
MTVRTRFAPSPTGYLHIGGVRTALFNWLFARRHGGTFILRIDDTDAERNVEEALEPILSGLKWLGIDWDEGPGVGGPHAPYFQSQRADRHRDAVERLLASGHAYRDFATTGELELYGFDVLDPDYYSDYSSVTQTTVYYSLGNEQAAATVAATLPSARIERVSGLGETVQVALGPDFTDVRYPQASGTPLTVSVTHLGSSTPTKLPSDLTVINGADVTCE